MSSISVFSGGGGGGGGTPGLLLGYSLAGDLAPALLAGTWTDIIGNQSFTVGAGSSLIGIVVRGYAAVTASGVTNGGSRIVIDSAGTPINKPVGGCRIPPGGEYSNVLAGSALIPITLSAGSHTIKLQAFIEGLAGTVICSAATSPNAFSLSITVVEFR